MNAMSDGFVNTVDDFGRQWENYTENTGYYASTDVLLSLVGPLLTPLDIRGKTVADVGLYALLFFKAEFLQPQTRRL